MRYSDRKVKEVQAIEQVGSWRVREATGSSLWRAEEMSRYASLGFEKGK